MDIELFDGLSTGQRNSKFTLRIQYYSMCNFRQAALPLCLRLTTRLLQRREKTFSIPQRDAGTHRESLPNMFEKQKYFK